MSSKKVVITGMGIISPVGNNITDSWDNLVAGKSGISNIDFFDTTDLSVKFSGSIKNFDATDYNIAKKDLKKMDTFIHYGIAASVQAMEDAKITINAKNADRIGVAIGSGIGGLSYIQSQHEQMIKKGTRRVSPFFVPGSIINMISGHVSIMYGLQGPNIALVTACTTATHSIGMAARLIQHGDADVMIAGGAEMATCRLGVAGFASARALSSRNDDPKTASRPWDKDRDGFVLGDGAGVLVLESEEHAKKRGAKIYATLDGFGMSGDAYHMTLPAKNGDGAKRCMVNALKDANMNAKQIDYINAHGTSTPAGDIAETQAIKNAFGEHSKKLTVSSTKSMTGHLLGAAGGIEAIFSILSLQHQIIPPTINIFNQDLDCDLDYSANSPTKRQIKTAMSNSFGFGGTNGTLIFSTP
ncbi:MAG: beta-ketoacyl-[acyl-carrier-protein] synthase II [Gammaproteobacteria bacterium]|nr:MAG: beta-ketoacyl-[acyl-carrier-protein] synthase II [Gammaproteobacteria bacterium]